MGVEAELEKKRRRRSSSEEITALIEQHRQSGQTRREFCQSHGLALSSFQVPAHAGAGGASSSFLRATSCLSVVSTIQSDGPKAFACPRDSWA